MKRAVLLSIWAVISLLAVSSCKKDEDEEIETNPSLEGTLSFSIPTYIKVGDTLTLAPSGVSRPSDDTSEKSLGVAWKVTPVNSAYDTVRVEGADTLVFDGTFTFVVPDTLCTLSSNCLVYAYGYSNSTASSESVIVSYEKSMTGFEYDGSCFEFTDSRDGNVYKARKIGNTDWMCQNIRYAGSGQSFYKSSVMDTLFGRMYSWEEAGSVCPEGWRLPSNRDWMNLAGNLGDASASDTIAIFHGIAGSMLTKGSFNGEKFWEYNPKVNLTASSSLNFIPSGFANLVGNGASFSYAGYQIYALFWTSDSVGENGYYRYVYADSPDLYIGKADKSGFIIPVRCIRQ